MCADSTSSDSSPSTGHTNDRTGYDPITETFHARFDTDEGADAVVVTVVETVAIVTGREVTDMPPLFATIDAEALTTLVTSSRDQRLEVTFSYEGCRVTVSSYGDVVVELLDQ